MSQRAADSRRNSLTSISTTNSAISNIAMNPQQSASSVRALSTDQLISIDNKFVKKNAKKPTSENFYHKAQGTYYFPNGEVFRPRISPSRRHKPGKVQGKGGYHYVPQPGNPGAPSPRQHYQPIQPQVTHQSAQGHLSTSGPDSNVNGNIPRSYSSSNVKRLNSSKNLAQTLRSTKADLPTNVTLFQQHLQQQHQQHQPGHIPQQYSQQFQQFQQFQQHQQQQIHYPHTPDKHSPVLHHPPQFQSQSQSNIPIIPHPSPQAVQMQQFSQYQAATSNSSSSTSLRTLQSNNVVKGLVLLTDGSEKSLENNLKSDSNLSSISNYTLNRSTSNTPQTSVNNSVEDEKDRSDSSRPNSHSSVHQSDEEVKPLKDIEETREIKFNEPEELRTPDAESCEVFSTPMGEKFETPQSSPTVENKSIELTLNEIGNPGSNNEVNTHESNTPQASRASSVGETSIYSSDTSSVDAELQSVSLESLSLKSNQESSETQFGDAESKSLECVAADDKTGSASEVEVAEKAVETSVPSDLSEAVPEVPAEVPEVPVEAPAEVAADTTRDSSAIDTKSKDGVSELGRGINLEESLQSQASVVEDGFTKSYESLSSHSSTDMSSLPSPKSLDNHSHEDVDDLINTYQAESPLSKKDFVDINNEKILDSLMNDSQSAPRRGDITVVDNTVRKHQRKSSSISSFNSILRGKDANENKQIDESMLSPTPSIKGELEVEVQNEDKEEVEAPKEDILPNDTLQHKAKVTQPEASNSTKEITASSLYKPKSMLDVLDSEKSKPKSMLDVLDKQEEKKDKSIEESSKVIDIPLDIKYESPKKPLKEEPKTPTKPKKKAPSGSPLVDRAKGETVQDQKVLPSTPKTNQKEIKNVKSMSSLPNEKKSTRWKRMFNIKDGTMPTNRSASDSRTSFDVKSVASNKSGNQSITSSKFKLSKKTFSFRDLKISSFKNNHENAPPVPDVNMYLPEDANPKSEADDPFVDSEELTLTKLPSIESDDNMFDDVLLTFDEKLEVVGRKGTLLKKPTKITEPFLKDDELTRDQIEDQQIKDKLMNTHSRSNSDDYIDENLQFLKEELIWPIDNDVKSFKSAEEKLVRNVPTNDNDKTLGGEEDIFFIDNEQLNNLFNNINDSQRRKLPMHLKYIKQFKDYDMLEINIKKFEHLPTSSLDVTEKAANPILKRRTKYGTHSGVLSSKDRYKTPSMDKKGKVQFSSKISINETFSPDLYSRYNKSVTQYTLTEPSEINKIKNELNDYKCNEMLVHEQSQTNTHFFY